MDKWRGLTGNYFDSKTVSSGTGMVFPHHLLHIAPEICPCVLTAAYLSSKKNEYSLNFLKNIFIEFIGVTLVRKIIKISNVQFCHSSLCVHHPKSSLCHPSSPLPSSTCLRVPFPLVLTVLSGSVRTFLFFFFSLWLISPNPLTSLSSDSWQSVLCNYESVSILFTLFIRFHR